jgi:sulfite exporter TauE/SafE
MVFFFVGLALRWERHIPKLFALTRLTWKLQASLRGRSRVDAAAALGFATPLLPCGPLYFVTSLALLSGSALRGVEFMLAFGLGTVPLLWLAQSQFQWVRQKLSPLWLNRVRVSVALSAALVVGWRLRGTLGFAGPDPSSFICF